MNIRIIGEVDMEDWADLYIQFEACQTERRGSVLVTTARHPDLGLVIGLNYWSCVVVQTDRPWSRWRGPTDDSGEPMGGNLELVG